MDWKWAIKNLSEPALRDIAAIIVHSAIREYKNSPNKKNHNWFYSRWGKELIAMSGVAVSSDELLERIKNGALPGICEDER